MKVANDAKALAKAAKKKLKDATVQKDPAADCHKKYNDIFTTNEQFLTLRGMMLLTRMYDSQHKPKNLTACKNVIDAYSQIDYNQAYDGFCDKVSKKHKTECLARTKGTLTFKKYMEKSYLSVDNLNNN